MTLFIPFHAQLNLFLVSSFMIIYNYRVVNTVYGQKRIIFKCHHLREAFKKNMSMKIDAVSSIVAVAVLLVGDY